MKKKILGVALVVCILVLSVASVTMAYFTDTKSASNTFTVGNVEIALYETDNDGNVTEITQGVSGFEYTNKYPGQTFAKTPTIKNVAEDAAYVAGIIQLGSGVEASVNTLLADDDAVKAFLTGGILNDGAAADVKILRDAASDTITIYIIAKNALDAEEEVALFDKVAIPHKWDRVEMTKFAELTISVQAFAVQTSGFTSATEAIQAAFSDGDYNSSTAFDPYFN